MGLEALNCTQCNAPLSRMDGCDYCGTNFILPSSTSKQEEVPEQAPHPWQQQIAGWMEEGHFVAALHYEPEHPTTPTLVCGYRGDESEITIRSEGPAPMETANRLIQSGRILL